MPPSSILLLRRHRDESGQAFVLLALVLIVLLGMGALVLDVDYAFYVQRSLQASADAAALAAAQELPDPAAARSVGLQYGANSGGKNRRDNVPGVTTSVTTRCATYSPCRPVNAVVVTETATVPTKFARVLGIDTFTIHARATACSPRSSAPVDVMLVLDRTGSMCEDSNGNPDPACTDLNNARSGMKTFLAYMDPANDWVGFAVFPPARSSQAGAARLRPRTTTPRRRPTSSCRSPTTTRTGMAT